MSIGSEVATYEHISATRFLCWDFWCTGPVHNHLRSAPAKSRAVQRRATATSRHERGTTRLGDACVPFYVLFVLAYNNIQVGIIGRCWQGARIGEIVEGKSDEQHRI